MIINLYNLIYFPNSEYTFAIINLVIKPQKPPPCLGFFLGLNINLGYFKISMMIDDKFTALTSRVDLVTVSSLSLIMMNLCLSVKN